MDRTFEFLNNKSLRTVLVMFALSLNISACTKESSTSAASSEIECPVPLKTFNQDEKEIARKILESKGIPLTTDSFIEAIDSKDETSVSDMIKLGVSLDAYGDRGETPLTAALSFRSTKAIVEMLVNSGANVNAPNRDGGIPFVLAINGQHDSATVILMLDHCTNVNGKSMLAPPGHGPFSEMFETPLTAAINRENLPLVQLLIQKGADVNQKGGLGNQPPLNWAVGYGIEFVKPLVENGADVNLGNDDGWTPLKVAIQNNLFDIAKFLKEHGAK